ncbi:MAG: hypothetical protein ACP5D8_09530 [Fidelibacterota bacterium]
MISHHLEYISEELLKHFKKKSLKSKTGLSA